MAIRDEDFGAALTSAEEDDGGWSFSATAAVPSPPRDWQSLYEEAQARAETERARADAADARAEELIQAERAARSQASSLKSQLDKSRNKLKAAVEEVKEVRRAAKDALFLRSEVERLETLLSQAGVESSRRSTIVSLRMEVFQLREALQASAAGQHTTLPSPGGSPRSFRALERAQEQKDEIAALRRKVAALGRSKRAAAPRASARLRKALERARKQKDTIKALRQDVGSLNRENRRLRRELQPLQDLKATVRRLSREVKVYRGALAGFYDQMDLIASLKSRVWDLEVALREAAIRKQELEAELAARLPLPVAFKRLRNQDKTIESLRKKTARLGEANERQRRKINALRSRNRVLEARIAKLHSSRSVLSKALYGRKSEKQKRPGTGRKRGQQRGAPGHGRTQRPGLKEKKERRTPPKDARICSCCGKPYVANGERSTSLIEIEVEATSAGFSARAGAGVATAHPRRWR